MDEGFVTNRADGADRSDYGAESVVDLPDLAPRELDRLLGAVLSVTADLSLPTVLRRITEAACDLTGARFGALGVLGPNHRLSEFITVGLDGRSVAAIGAPPEGHGILGLLINEPRAIRLPDMTGHPMSYGLPAGHPPMRSFLGVPVLVRGEVFGNLYLTEKAGAPEFTSIDEETVQLLASAAGVAIDNARLHGLAREYAVLEDRERIARDLHDTVIQRIFATGMSLQAVQRRIADPEVSLRLAQAIDELDSTIKEVRSAIFALEHQSQGGRGLRTDVLDIASEASAALGFDPSVSFEGPVDSAVPEGVADHVLAVVREALSNIARHAAARHAWVRVSVSSEVRIEVSDDGVGPGAAPGRVGGHGLKNMAERARALGGSATVSARAGGGTELVWRIPLDL